MPCILSPVLHVKCGQVGAGCMRGRGVECWRGTQLIRRQSLSFGSNRNPGRERASLLGLDICCPLSPNCQLRALIPSKYWGSLTKARSHVRSDLCRECGQEFLGFVGGGAKTDLSQLMLCVCTHACTKNESLICLQSRNVDFTPLLARSAFVPCLYLGRKKVR